ncbi:hypothetical protein PMI05_05183 [Brevibacillus sp. BC25]|nr:hypothetical protein PMI05_05183 [Brevibacillus sp. BC25]
MPPLIPMITVNVAGNFSDPDGEPLTFSVSSIDGSTATATVNASGIVQISRFPSQMGTVTVTITATDTKGATVWDTFQVDMH